VGSLGIGLLLGSAAAILAVETKSLLIGESASAEMQRMILAALEEDPGVMQVIHLRTVHIGPDSLLVAAKIAVRETDSAAQLAAAINAAEEHVRTAVPIATTIYLEPDIYRPAMADQTDPSIRTVLSSRAPRPSRTPRPSRSLHLPRRDRPANPTDPASAARREAAPESPADPVSPTDPESPADPESSDKPRVPDNPSVPDPGASASENPSAPTPDPESPKEHQPPALP
jgi:hypothetical protein